MVLERTSDQQEKQRERETERWAREEETNWRASKYTSKQAGGSGNCLSQHSSPLLSTLLSTHTHATNTVSEVVNFTGLSCLSATRNIEWNRSKQSHSPFNHTEWGYFQLINRPPPLLISFLPSFHFRLSYLLIHFMYTLCKVIQPSSSCA